ncbi:hypothetical protein RINTU1_14630 [Candidatus Regiella insecticola]|uniref:Uncharacterized protein n=1 Tax=Candidatus Regiella insecticola TaxID=138073 RepID=A0A6L2ZMH1_9ENTR|nr:hypothetical protein RINTU1_14630 [Candidatus Regiella insecticola]
MFIWLDINNLITSLNKPFFYLKLAKKCRFFIPFIPDFIILIADYLN